MIQGLLNYITTYSQKSSQYDEEAVVSNPLLHGFDFVES